MCVLSSSGTKKTTTKTLYYRSFVCAHAALTHRRISFANMKIEEKLKSVLKYPKMI